MDRVHRFIGSHDNLDWENVPDKIVSGSQVFGVSGKVLIGPLDDASNFRMRHPFRYSSYGH